MSEPNAAQKQSYATLAASQDFKELRKRYRNFAFPWTVAFMVWYLLFVICANWAPGFMSTKLVGNINIALVFGLLQFVSTFFIAWLYSRYMNRNVDALARDIELRYNEQVRGSAR